MHSIEFHVDLDASQCLTSRLDGRTYQPSTVECYPGLVRSVAVAFEFLRQDLVAAWTLSTTIHVGFLQQTAA